MNITKFEIGPLITTDRAWASPIMGHNGQWFMVMGVIPVIRSLFSKLGLRSKNF